MVTLLTRGSQGDEEPVCEAVGHGCSLWPGKGSRAIREHVQTPKKAHEPSASDSTSFQPKVFCDSVIICLSWASVQSNSAVLQLFRQYLLQHHIEKSLPISNSDLPKTSPTYSHSVATPWVGENQITQLIGLPSTLLALQSTNSCPYSFWGL